MIPQDITIRERIVLPLEDRPVLRGYEEYRDLPEDVRVRVYSLNEAASEKIVALLDRARNEPRDLYDLWFLTSGGHVNLSDLVNPVARKLEFRGLTLAQVGKELTAKEARHCDRTLATRYPDPAGNSRAACKGHQCAARRGPQETRAGRLRELRRHATAGSSRSVRLR